MFGISNLAIFSSLGAAGFAYFVFQLIQHRRFYNDLPKPPHSFLWGHLKLVGEAIALFPHDTPIGHPITYIAQKYSLPEIFYLDMWPVAGSFMIMISGDAAAQITTVRAYHTHPFSRRLLTPIIGANNIATSSGDLWKILHHMLGPAFVPRYTKTLLGTLTDETLIFHERLKTLADKGDFSMADEISRPLFDIIGKIIFGFSLHAQESGSPILTDIKYTLNSFPTLYLSWNLFKKWWVRLKLRLATHRIDGYIITQAKEAFAVLKSEKKHKTSKNASGVLERVLLTKLEENPGAEAEVLDPEYLQLIADNMKTLLIAGFSTSVDSLCYIYTLLGTHPDVMKRLREEHDLLFGVDLATTARTIREYPSKTNELEYTNAVIKETIRLFPIGGGIKENPKGSTSLQYKSRSYPTENQKIMIPPQAIHYDPRYFPEPSRFLPDRHLDSYKPKIQRNTLRPFEQGLRQCLGQDLAMDKLRVMLLLTARWFDFEPVVEPRKIPRVAHTNLDLKLGDQAFQQLAMTPGVRDGAKMRIKSTGRA